VVGGQWWVRTNTEKQKHRKTMEKQSIYERIKETLAVTSQLIIASPLKLPPKVVAAAKYLALALGVLEAVEGAAKKGADDDED